MGECGCTGEYIAKLPGPREGEWYVVELYKGCEFCRPDWAIVIHWCRKGGGLESSMVEDAPEAEPDHRRMWLERILDGDLLAKVLGDEVAYMAREGVREFVNRADLGRLQRLDQEADDA